MDDQDKPAATLTTAEAASLLNVQPDTLRRLRLRGAGPAFARSGPRVLYHRAELDAWATASRRRRRARWSILIATAAVLALLAVLYLGKRPMFLWNTTPSVPLGLYLITSAPSSAGSIVVARLPSSAAQLAARRSYLSATAYLLKPVAATNGDRVCRFGAHIFVRHKLAALALATDHRARPLPRWQGCRTLRAGEVFLLGATPDSFDSRYFGPIGSEMVIGTAALIWQAG
ncbi:S26 family signal peptidase [Hyphomicrobium sp. CS1BSMeth3]|uniref:S26 family signal peptidase n=1 Tax=Hyphomicrobium sp. CS1BSMeth3 TaxID=1892844 RepID=UPI0009FB7A32|nr:S26 family signal peptidase [Hyphomicrobium sp. CS1BSMeth3]